MSPCIHFSLVSDYVHLLFTEKLELFNNKFSGTISEFFGLLPNLVTLDLHSNQFGSIITSGLCTKQSLKKLDLGNNNIQGQIPDLSGCAVLGKS